MAARPDSGQGADSNTIRPCMFEAKPMQQHRALLALYPPPQPNHSKGTGCMCIWPFAEQLPQPFSSARQDSHHLCNAVPSLATAIGGCGPPHPDASTTSKGCGRPVHYNVLKYLSMGFASTLVAVSKLTVLWRALIQCRSQNSMANIKLAQEHPSAAELSSATAITRLDRLQFHSTFWKRPACSTKNH